MKDGFAMTFEATGPVQFARLPILVVEPVYFGIVLRRSVGGKGLMCGFVARAEGPPMGVASH